MQKPLPMDFIQKICQSHDPWQPFFQRKAPGILLHKHFQRNRLGQNAHGITCTIGIIAGRFYSCSQQKRRNIFCFRLFAS